MEPHHKKRKRDEPAAPAQPFNDKALAEFTDSGADLLLRCKDGRVLPVHKTLLQLASKVLKDMLEDTEIGGELTVRFVLQKAWICAESCSDGDREAAQSRVPAQCGVTKHKWVLSHFASPGPA